MLEIRNVYKGYGKKSVLEDVSLKIAPGEIHGLIGENSAGKTTLIKCVTGVYKVEKGQICYAGEEVFDNPGVKAKIGYVADYNDYIKYYTVSQMVHMYEVFYENFNKEKFNGFNKLFQIPVKQRIYSLSKGQKMRLAFMLETAKQPEYLILDEPTSGLDPMAKRKFFELLIREVEERNIGVLISSHNLDGIEKICDSVTMLHEGKVEKQMAVEQLKEQLTKIQVVFEHGAGKEIRSLPQIVSISNVGSIYTMLVKDYDESFRKVLRSNGAGMIEAVELSLEELFITLEESRR